MEIIEVLNMELKDMTAIGMAPLTENCLHSFLW